MSEDQLEIRAQSALQQFDDACDSAETDPVALGRAAVDALDELMAFWTAKSFMVDEGAKEAAGGDHALKAYGGRQLQWAAHEKERVLALITVSK